MGERRTSGRWAAVAVGLSVGLGVALAGGPAEALPPFDAELTPGQLRGIAWQPGDPWPAGYWEYLPANYDMVPPDHLYPLLVTLGGIGTMDDDSSCPGGAGWCSVAECEAAGGPDGVCRVYRRGPAVEIRQGVWDDVTRPFIVIQIQNSAPTFSSVDYDRDVVDATVQFVLDNYPVDPRRAYLLGNSQGGRAVLQYTSLYSRRMAAVTMGPGGMVADGDAACLFQDTAFWAFHGENDDDQNIGVGVFDPCWVADQLRMYNEPDQYPGLMGCVDRVGTPFPQGRITMFDNTAHDAWTPGFENISVGFNRPTWTMDQMCGFEANWTGYTAAISADGVYTWLLEHDRPDVEVDDFVVPGDVAQFALDANTLDDDAVAHTWTQTGGPPVTLLDADQQVATVTDFAYDEVYTFEVFAVDADNQWDLDEVEVTVEVEIPSASTGSMTTGEGGSSGTGSVDDTGTGPGTDSAGSTSIDPSGPDSGPDSGPVTETSGEDDSSGTGESGGQNDGDGGCGCIAGRGSQGGAWLGLLGLLALRRRRLHGAAPR